MYIFEKLPQILGLLPNRKILFRPSKIGPQRHLADSPQPKNSALIIVFRKAYFIQLRRINHVFDSIVTILVIHTSFSSSVFY